MRHRVLIADDDGFIRKILGNLLQKLDCEIAEAGDGAEALALIASHPPDLVLLDVQMPVLNGLETLEEIRSSMHARHLPVVAVSGHTERALVMRLIELGIADFVMKPLRPQEVLRRVHDVLKRLQRESAQTLASLAAPGRERQQLLLVDHDVNFRQFVRSLVETQYEVIEADTGAVGLKLFRESMPDLVLVGADIPLLRARRLVEMLRASETTTRAGIFLVDASADGEFDDSQELDGVLLRSFVPEVFTRELERAVRPRSDGLRTYVRTRLLQDLVTAAQQSIGVLTGQETVVIGEERLGEVPREVSAGVQLRAGDAGAAIRIELIASVCDVETIGSKILGSPVRLDEGAGDAVEELVNTIGGRVRAVLAERGVRFEQDTPALRSDPVGLDSAAADLCLVLETAGGERMVIVVTVEDAPAPAQPELSEMEAA